MKAHRLNTLMQRIIKQLLKSQFQNDFLILDSYRIRESQGEICFIWQIHPEGTWLYTYDQEDWEKELLDRIESYRERGINSIYYRYDKTKLVPIFESEVRYLARKRLEVRNKNNSKYEKQELARCRQ